MISRKSVVENAKTFVGTPFHHQGRLPGVGMDCIGLLVCVAHSLGIEVVDKNDYPKSPDGKLLQYLVSGGLVPVARDALDIGDVMVFSIRNEIPRHCGILVSWDPLEMIHAAQPHPIAQVPVDPRWQQRLLAVLRFPGVSNE